MSENLKIGQIITTPQNRDAIHIAVIPITAAEAVEPAEHICLIDGKAYSGHKGQPVGIVDPFLTHGVRRGDTFWLFLFPGSVTSLRHAWTHPAFDTTPPEEPLVASQPKDEAIEDVAKHASDTWIHNFAGESGLDYDEIIEGAKDYISNQEYINKGELLDGLWVPDEFWDHFERVTNIVVPANKRGSFFSCSC